MSTQATILIGDAAEKLHGLQAHSIHCCVTSPPYWGLRDYGVAGQIGLEATPEEYVAAIAAVFREVWRVLRPDGTLWLNLGDSYASNGGHSDTSCNDRRGQYNLGNRPEHDHRAFRVGAGAVLKAKDMVGIPWRVAFALQADGWYLRSDIIWHKPNPMPESATDRPTKAHEYIFLLTKSERYFYDAEAIKEQVTGNAHARGDGVNPKAKAPNGWDTSKGQGGHGTIHKDGRTNGTVRTKQNADFSAAVTDLVANRNKRSVWTVPTAPFAEAHFATFPPDLIKPCILAGTSSAGCCQCCGAPLERVVEKGEPDIEHQRACGGDSNGLYDGQSTKDYAAAKAQDPSAVKARILAGMRERVTVAWKPTCKCLGGDTKTKPCTVLDPFGGSGTTGMVANELGRKAVLIELNPKYAAMADVRVGTVTMGLAL